MKTQFLKTVTLGLALTGAALPAMAQDDGTSRWVSDELTTYVRSGPTDGYRIVGTLTAGQPVTLLDTSGDYSQVRSDSGDVVWVPSSELQQTPSASDQLPKLEARVEELTEELDGINESWEERTRTMTETLEVRESIPTRTNLSVGETMRLGRLRSAVNAVGSTCSASNRSCCTSRPTWALRP